MASKKVKTIELSTCKHCGCERFVAYSELDFEGKIVADSRSESGFVKHDAESRMVCTRCFSTAERTVTET